MAPRPPKLETYRDAEIASTYDKRWAGRMGMKRDARKLRALQKALNHLKQIAGDIHSLLDTPCGTGRFTSYLQKNYPFVIGADLAPAMLKEAQQKTDADAHLLSCDVAQLPFQDDAFDASLCIRFLHLIRDPQLRVSFLKEICRVSRKGAVIDYRHRHTFRIWGRHLRHKLGLRKTAPGNPSLKQIRVELHQAGFAIQKVISVRKLPFTSDKILFVVTPSEAPK